MPFGKYKDMPDCIAKNSDAEDPGAYCAQIHKDITGKWPSEAMQRDWDKCIAENQNKLDPEKHCAEALGIPLIHTGFEHEKHEAMRHPDFQKIYTQFMTHIKPEEEAVNRYHSWVTALNLDETKSYGHSQKEQFKWVQRHVDFNLWKEDRQAKYWQVEAGFPLESMNLNVYSEQELVESARTIKGKMVNVNHKFQLPTIEIVAGKWEDGVVESVLRVPQRLRCPICSENKTVNDLIETGGIVNVSLEAACTLKSDDSAKCEGMEFTGLALLTKDVLPGIPLTRMMPLEQIMVEALHVDETKGKETRRRKVKKIKMEVLEQDEEPEKDEHGCEIGTQKWNPETEQCEPIPAEEQVTTTDTTPDTGPGLRQLKPKSIQPDEHGQCPPGYILSTQLGNCILDESCPEGQHFDQNEQKCLPDTVPKPETPETAVGTPAAPREDVLTDAPTEMPTAGEQPPLTHPKIGPMPPSGEPAPEATPPKPTAPEKETPPDSHTCPDDYHYVPGAVPPCVPNKPMPEPTIGVTAETLPTLEEKVGRLKAEKKAESLKEKVASWELDYAKLYEQYQRLTGAFQQQRVMIEKVHVQKDNAVRDFNNKCVEAEKWKRLRDEASGLRDDYMHQLETTKTTLNDVTRKYNDSLGTNLELSRKLTQAHEDYLEVASKTERLEAQLNKAKSISKKIYKLRV